MTDFGQFYCFRDNQLELVTSAPESEVELQVADSWLVEDGRVRNIQKHFDRFGQWVQQVNPNCSDQLEDFFSAVREAIPKTGRWFPRIEFHGEGQSPHHLYLRLREAPEQLGAISLWTNPETDPRKQPTIKGPDLSLCLQLRRAAKMHGADEAVLLSSDGYISEGALSALVWWRGDVLCAPDSQTDWLASITRDEIFSIAADMGLATKVEKAKPADLVGLEIWALSSLQGIRVVDKWVNLGAQVGPAKHVEAFQKRLRLQSTLI